jgi:hypothetical protein
MSSKKSLHGRLADHAKWALALVLTNIYAFLLGAFLAFELLFGLPRYWSTKKWVKRHSTAPTYTYLH